VRGRNGWLLKSLASVAAESAIPPFVAEGRLLTQEFRTDTNLNYRTDASVVFLYSNGWWQVEARCKYVNQGNTIVHNCMRIPDGTRSYLIFEGSTNTGLTTVADACPSSFPPPGKTELLVPWLALCPHSELPLTIFTDLRKKVLTDWFAYINLSASVDTTVSCRVAEGLAR